VVEELIADLFVVPDMVTEEFLDGADGHPGSEGDGFGGFACEIGQQATGTRSRPYSH
jgi:hypothetical protein